MKPICLLLVYLFFNISSFAQSTVNTLLIARNTGKKGLANQDTIRVFGFAKTLNEQPGVPGPTIVANEGDSVHIDLWNISQGAPHTIHLHGLDVDQQNDGVPHLSFDVPHMGHGYYHFKAPHAGTYLYHCHVASTIHVQAGMYGLIIIKSSDGGNTTWNNGFPFSREYSYFLSEIDTVWHNDTVLNHPHDTSHIQQVHIPTFDPQFFLINGLSDQQLVEDSVRYESGLNETVYLRFANIGYYGVEVIFPSQLNSQIVASDGRPLPVLEHSDTLAIYPGERYGVLTSSAVEFTGKLQFRYHDLNTMTVKNTQVIPVNVSRFLAVENVEENALLVNVVPNPFSATSSLQFSLDQAAVAKLTIFDVTGSASSGKTIQVVCKQGQNAIPLENYMSKKGYYIVQLDVPGRPLSTSKVIKL
jgi:FtsP/CotA-like multicopper oxidase with cupredoxin domain